MRHGLLTKLSITVQVVALVGSSFPANAQIWPYQAMPYAHNMGPDVTTEGGREMMDVIYRQGPEYDYLQKEFMPEGIYRHAWGPNPVRLNFAPNSMQVIVQGQDSVDDAEATKSPGVGTGYAQYVQEMMKALGIRTSFGTTNASFQTIKGQYGSFDHPIVKIGANGEREIVKEKVVDNYLWTLFNGRESIVAQHHNRVWFEMIKNNQDSLRAIVLLGGASHDSFAQLINASENFRIHSKISPEDMGRYQKPASKIVWGGGNNVFPVLLNKEGGDLYEELVGRKLSYDKPADQLAATRALEEAGTEVIERMAFEGGGVKGSGFVDPAQMRGYDYERIEKLVDGRWVPAESLKGMKWGDVVITNNVGVVASPHPTALVRAGDRKAAGRRLTEIFKPLRGLQGFADGKIIADIGENGKPMEAPFFEGKAIDFGKSLLPRNVLPFGIPEDLIRPTESPDRIGPQVLVVEPPSSAERKAEGVRKLDDLFEKEELEAAKKAQPFETLNPADVLSQRPRQSDTYLLHDPGPNMEWAEFIDRNLNRDILNPKPGIEKVVNAQGEDVTLNKVGAKGYFIKSPRAGFYAHYRGKLDRPEVMFMHDRVDVDDKDRYRAASGERGVYLNGIASDLGVLNRQLVLATVPADTVGASAEELEVIRKATEGYREAMLQKILSQGSVKVIFTDGEMAKFETERILKKLGVKNVPVIDIPRGRLPNSGIARIRAQLKQIPQFASATITGKPVGIGPEQLPWTSRATEGKFVGTVVEAKGKWKGRVRALVLPTVAFRQETFTAPATVRSVLEMNKRLTELGLRTAKETLPEFFRRTGRTGKIEPQTRTVERESGRTERTERRANERSSGAAGSCKSLLGL